MQNELSLRGELLLSRECLFFDSEGDSLRRAATSGSLHRVRRGAYVDRAAWIAASPRDRYIRLVHAVAATREVPGVVARQSAAALWMFPRIGAWPSLVHLIPLSGSGSHSRNGVSCHNEALPVRDVDELLGLSATSRLRTTVDLARTDTFAEAVVVLDHVLNARTSAPYLPLSKQNLLGQLGETESSRGVARTARAIEFASTLSGSPGESFSRVLMHQLGFAPPTLQTEHANPRGGRYFTDFEWPEARVVGEFDGRSKYLKPEYLGDMDAGEAVVREKIREDHLRAEGNGIVRWTWDDLRSPQRFARLLSHAGVPFRRRRAALEIATSVRERQA